MSRKSLKPLVSLALIMALVFCGASALTPVAAASAAPVSGEIVVMTNMVANQSAALGNISKAFAAANPNVKVTYVPGTGEYEVQMRVRMAANDMPDVFSTHGWAKARYGNFLADLSKESWAPRVSPIIKPLITDDTGKLYVLPVDIEKSGFVFNAQVLGQYGISIPTTMAEFDAACAAILQKSGGTVTPIHLGGGDDWMIGQICDYMGIPAAVSPRTNDRAAIAAKTYDWKSFEVVPTLVQDWIAKGYFNRDALTAKYTDSIAALASGRAAFVLHTPAVAIEAKLVRPRGSFGIMPVPAIHAGDVRTFSGGEHLTIGAWKDSESLPAAKAWINYLARPDKIMEFCAASGLPAGLTGVTPDLGDLQVHYDRYPTIRTFGYFDRDLPDGIWQAFIKNGSDLFGKRIDATQFNANMLAEYNRLK
jgi:raffinose/stachyose/melibiose transport system substrate-binding protein